jgi:hypothetical protein
MSISPLTDQRAPDWDTAWASALEDLEIGLTEAESLLSASHTIPAAAGLSWTPPQLEGPLPGNLLARAEAIMARHVRVSEQLGRGMAVNRRELRLAQRMESGSMDRTKPAFVDTRF